MLQSRRAFPIAILVASCSSSTATQSSPDAEPSQAEAGATQCPATVAETVGAPCNVAGLQCGPSYACDFLELPLLCTCDGASFQCIDGTGKTVGPGDTPSCEGPREAGSCPPTEAAALLTACSDPGLSCPYASDCAGAVDVCQCFPIELDDGGEALLFQCSPGTCAQDAGEEDQAEAESDAATAPASDSTVP